MAIVEYGALVTDIRGSIGGLTFQHTTAGKIVKLKSTKFKSQTEKSHLKHSLLVSNIINWKNLSLANKILWNNYAGLNDKYDKFGRIRKLTGMNWHMSINHNINLINGSYVSIPPVYVLPDSVPDYEIILSSSSIIVRFNSLWTPSNTAVKIWATTPLLTSSMCFNQFLKYLLIDVTCSYLDIDITAEWNTATGLNYSNIYSSGNFYIGVLIEPVEITSAVSYVPKKMLKQTIKKAFTFATNRTGTFTPSITTSDTSIATWTIPGHASQTTNTPSFTLTGTDKVVAVDIVDYTKITSFIATGQDIKGLLDISLLTHITNLQVGSNTGLTNITNPINSQIFTHYLCGGCDITGTLDLSTLTNLGGQLQIFGNSNLTMVINPVSSQVFTHYFGHDCDITGTLDLSTLANLGGFIYLRNNTNLLNILLPTTNQSFNQIQFNNCNLGVLVWASLTGNVSNIQVQDNNFTSSESDENIDLIAWNVNLSTSLNIAGTNGILTDGSTTGYDGLGAKDILEFVGVTVSYN